MQIQARAAALWKTQLPFSVPFCRFGWNAIYDRIRSHEPLIKDELAIVTDTLTECARERAIAVNAWSFLRAVVNRTDLRNDHRFVPQCIPQRRLHVVVPNYFCVAVNPCFPGFLHAVLRGCTRFTVQLHIQVLFPAPKPFDESRRVFCCVEKHRCTQKRRVS